MTEEQIKKAQQRAADLIMIKAKNPLWSEDQCVTEYNLRKMNAANARILEQKK